MLGAESQGQIGFLLEEALSETLPDLDFAALLTQVITQSPSLPRYASLDNGSE